MSSRQKNRIVELEITSYSAKGYGVGQCLNGAGLPWTVEVPFTAPGDRVRVQLMGKRSGVYSSFLEEVIVPSPLRTVPRCSHFGHCGGCRWQHLPYSRQLEEKEAIVRRHFAPFLNEGVKQYPILACDPPWHYRNKMEFSFSSNAAKQRFLGLIIDGSRGRVFNLTECHLVNTWFADAAAAVRKWWEQSDLDAYHMSRNTGSLRTLTLREGQRSGDRMAILTVSGNADFALNKQHVENFVSCLREIVEPQSPAKLSIFLRIQQIAKGSPTQFYEMQLYGPETIQEILHIGQESFEFQISPVAFFQPNTRQAEQLYARALELAAISPDSIVYDLYCGTGTLGMCAARIAKQVVGIELSPEAVLDARANAALNQLTNVMTLKGDVGTILAQIQNEQSYPKPQVVMVDPPRAGLDDQAIAHVLLLKPETIVYVSCNPATQAANMEKLIAGGYQLVAIQPVDQFPHTIHIENIAILKACVV